MSIIETVVRQFAPFTCLGCGAEEDLLVCMACLHRLTPVASRCYKCHQATEASMLCPGCRETSSLHSVVVHVEYRDVIRQVVHRMKYERAKNATNEIAHMLSQRAKNFPPDAIFVPIPTATSRVRGRGYDHAALLAKRTAALTHHRYMVLLRRLGQAHQMGSSRSTRLAQLKDAFRPVRREAIDGRHIVLVDDVLTTGATLENAARTLKRQGAARVDAIVLARA